MCASTVKLSERAAARRQRLADGVTVYDAAYVATAERHDWTLVSGDVADLVQPGLAIPPDADELES